jgi:hypothetical protein
MGCFLPLLPTKKPKQSNLITRKTKKHNVKSKKTKKTTEANYRRPSGLVWWSNPQSNDSKLHCTNSLGRQTKPDHTKEI